MRKFVMSLTTVASLSLAAVPVLGLAQAANAAEAEARIIVTDLNLAKPADARIFKARVDAAAEGLCESKQLRKMPRAFCRAEVRREADRGLSKQQRKNLQIAARAARGTELAAQ